MQENSNLQWCYHAPEPCSPYFWGSHSCCFRPDQGTETPPLSVWKTLFCYWNILSIIMFRRSRTWWRWCVTVLTHLEISVRPWTLCPAHHHGTFGATVSANIWIAHLETWNLFPLFKFAYKLVITWWSLCPKYISSWWNISKTLSFWKVEENVFFLLLLAAQMPTSASLGSLLICRQLKHF